MNDQLPDLVYPCAFALAQACQVAIGGVHAGSLTVHDLPALFKTIPRPASQPGAMLAAGTINRFLLHFGRAYHESFHGSRLTVRCKFRPDECHTQVQVGSGDWHLVDIQNTVRQWSRRYATAFAATHGRDVATLAVAHFATRGSDGHRLRQLARDFGCSPSTLRRHVVVVAGDTPLRIRTRARVLEALGLLRRTTWKIEVVALAVHWKSVKNLYHAFDVLVGMTPAEVRRLSDTSAAALFDRVGRGLPPAPMSSDFPPPIAQV